MDSSVLIGLAAAFAIVGAVVWSFRRNKPKVKDEDTSYLDELPTLTEKEKSTRRYGGEPLGFNNESYHTTRSYPSHTGVSYPRTTVTSAPPKSYSSSSYRRRDDDVDNSSNSLIVPAAIGLSLLDSGTSRSSDESTPIRNDDTPSRSYESPSY